jgi:Polyketide cyclase / dehydrase and lipid transport
MNKLRRLKEHNGIKLTEVSTSININALSDKTWDALSHYGDVHTFHGGVVNSVSGEESTNKAELGAVRTCDILDGKKEVMLKERITEYEEGNFYRYEVFEWKNFPLKVMFFAFSVNKINNKKSRLTLTINYRLNPGFMTNLMKWKIRKLEKSVLTGYRNYIETGEKNVPIKTLEKNNYQFA